MKTIIISDITSEGNSIIPYGLNIAKFNETRVDILHLIDPRGQQSSYSPYSDSHTVSPGEKQDQDTKIKKEMDKAHTLLDRLISKEGSRLNYPLRINQVIEVEPVQAELKNILDQHPELMVITSTTPSESMADNVAQLLEMIHELNCLVMVVLPGQKFIRPLSAVMYTEFSEEDAVHFTQLAKWLKPFNTKVEAVYISKESTNQEAENKSKNWLPHPETANDFRPETTTRIIYADDNIRAFLDHISQNEPDLVIIPRKVNTIFGPFLLDEKRAIELFEAIRKPVLLY
jgi:hypothetical protein